MSDANKLIGVFDLLDKPWCLRCWAAQEQVSDVRILAGDRRTPLLQCAGCTRSLADTAKDDPPVAVDIHLRGDSCWQDLHKIRDAGNLVWLTKPKLLAFARLPGGMQSGKSSVSIRIDLPDGKVVVAETSMRVFLSVADAFRGADAGPPPGPVMKG